MSDKPLVSGEEVAKHTTRETGVWVIVHGQYQIQRARQEARGFGTLSVYSLISRLTCQLVAASVGLASPPGYLLHSGYFRQSLRCDGMARCKLTSILRFHTISDHCLITVTGTSRQVMIDRELER
jgi:hypothetical protein